MKRREFLTYACAGLLVASPAFATDIEQSVLSQLRDQGFSTIQRSRTLLGRIRFVAVGPGMRREVILNPRTGEILRDFWKTTDNSAPKLLNTTSGDGGEASTSSSGGGEADDGGNDDHDDGDDDDGGDDDHGWGGGRRD